MLKCVAFLLCGFLCGLAGPSHVWGEERNCGSSEIQGLFCLIPGEYTLPFGGCCRGVPRKGIDINNVEWER